MSIAALCSVGHQAHQLCCRLQVLCGPAASGQFCSADRSNSSVSYLATFIPVLEQVPRQWADVMIHLVYFDPIQHPYQYTVFCYDFVNVTCCINDFLSGPNISIMFEA